MSPRGRSRGLPFCGAPRDRDLASRVELGDLSASASMPVIQARRGGTDALEIVAEQAAEPAGRRRQQAAGDEDPRLGARVAVRVIAAGAWQRRITSAKKSCTSRIWRRR